MVCRRLPQKQRVRRLAEEDMQFVRFWGVDENGGLRPMPQNLVGMDVNTDGLYGKVFSLWLFFTGLIR
jgi:hypothetical protein